MSGDGNTLHLEVNKRCGEGREGCNCGDDRPLGIEAKKEPNTPVNGFTKYIHRLRNGGPFKLNKTLKDGSKIIGESQGALIENVTEVAVYYWTGEHSSPILLGITGQNNAPEKTKYYGKAKGYSTWMNGRVLNMTEQQALDNQNCHNNNAIVFDIKDSQSGSFTDDSKSYCLKDYRKITLADSASPPGSDYISKAYIITGLDTKISRVTLRDNPINISPPTDPIDVITLYSYPASDQVPLMLELKPNVGDSKWYESTNKDGTQWREVGNGNTFYDKEGNPQPTPKLSEKLDEVLCKWYDNVTIDLSHSNSTSKRSYCCNEHKGVEKISVQGGSIRVNDQIKTSYYKHSLAPGTPVAGIYYKDGSNRNKITLPGVSFPISGINNVYVFYCQGEEPSLIYVDSQSAIARGWYKKDGDDTPWKWIGSIHRSITESNIRNGLDCRQWMKLRIVLEGCSCTGLSECSTPGKSSEQLKRELEKEMQEEEKIAEEERKRAIEKAKIQFPQSPPPLPLPGGAQVTSPGSGKSGSASRSVDQSPPPSSTSASPPFKPAPRTAVNGAAGGVTIQLDSKVSYYGHINGGDMIYVFPYTDTLITGYNAYEHMIRKSFRIKDFTVGDKEQKFQPPVTEVKDIKSIIVYFLSCENDPTSPVTTIPLLVCLTYGKHHKWYTRKKKGGKSWYDVSNKLIKGSPSEAFSGNLLQNALGRIKQNLKVDCGTPPVFKYRNALRENNEIGDGLSYNSYFGRYSTPGSVIPPPQPRNILGTGPNFRDDNEIIPPGHSSRGPGPGKPGTVEQTTDQSVALAGVQEPVVTPELQAQPQGTPVAQMAEDAIDASQDNATQSEAAQGSPETPGPPSPESSPVGEAQALVGELTTVASATSLWLTFGASSGTLAGSAATFFGGWKLYNRYKGDPWVRQI